MVFIPDPLVCVPESDRGRQSHGDDGVSRDGQHAPARVLPLGTGPFPGNSRRGHGRPDARRQYRDAQGQQAP